jgi:uncharacterized phage protein (TIGR01671 family)
MNREIKFRVWNHVSKKWMRIESIEFRKKGVLVFVVGKDGKTREGFWDVTDCNIVQYTGLKDKNEKEIYDGYIMKNIFTNKVEEIKFYGAAFVVGNYLIREIDKTDREIIGNKFENPELLK